MKIFNSLYLKKEVQEVYVGTIEGENCVKLWWKQ